MPRQTRLDYWIRICNGDIEEAKKQLFKRQQTSSLDRFMGIIGIEIP